MKLKVNRVISMFLAVLILVTAMMTVAVNAAGAGKVTLKLTATPETVVKGSTVELPVDFSDLDIPDGKSANAGLAGFAVCLQWDPEIFEFVSVEMDASIPNPANAGATENTGAGAVNISRGRVYFTYQDDKDDRPQDDYSLNVFPGDRLGTLVLRVKENTTATRAFIEGKNSTFSGSNFMMNNRYDIPGEFADGGCWINIVDPTTEYTVTTNYVERNKNNTLAQTKTDTVDEGTLYNSTPVKVTDYVVTGYKLTENGVVTKEMNKTKDDYANGAINLNEFNFSFTVANNSAIEYNYMEDKNGNEIPDEYEDASLTEIYRTDENVELDKNVIDNVILDDVVTSSPKTYDKMVCVGALVDGQGTLLTKQDYINNNWNPITINPVDVTITGVNTIEWVYMADENDNKIPDKFEKSIVTQKYTNDDEKTELRPSTSNEYFYNTKQTFTAPTISGFVCMGYNVSNGESKYLLPSDFENGAVTVSYELAIGTEDYTIEWLYSEGEGPIPEKYLSNVVQNFIHRTTNTSIATQDSTKKYLFNTNTDVLTPVTVTGYQCIGYENTTNGDKNIQTEEQIRENNGPLPVSYQFNVGEEKTHDVKWIYLTDKEIEEIIKDSIVTEKYTNEAGKTISTDTTTAVQNGKTYTFTPSSTFVDPDDNQLYVIYAARHNGQIIKSISEAEYKHAYENNYTVSMTVSIENIKADTEVTYIYKKAFEDPDKPIPPTPEEYLAFIDQEYYDVYGNRIADNKRTAVWAGDETYTSQAVVVTGYTATSYSLNGGAAVAQTSHTFVNIEEDQTIRFLYTVNHLTSDIYEIWSMELEDDRTWNEFTHDQFFLTNLTIGETINQMLSKFNDGYVGEIVAYYADGTPVPGSMYSNSRALTATGWIFKHIVYGPNGEVNVVREYETVLFGDVNGDQEINTQDYVDIQNLVKGMYFPSNAQYIAGLMLKEFRPINEPDVSELENILLQTLPVNQSIAGTDLANNVRFY